MTIGLGYCIIKNVSFTLKVCLFPVLITLGDNLFLEKHMLVKLNQSILICLTLDVL